MPSRESDRENLLREATALVERAELKIAGHDDPIVIGFRRDGSASFFFGADPVYQFNSAGELRRAYIAGMLYKAERGCLFALRRERSETEVALVRTELTPDETTALLTALCDHLVGLQQALASGNFTVNGQVPSNTDLVHRILEWLTTLPPIVKIADVPNTR